MIMERNETFFNAKHPVLSVDFMTSFAVDFIIQLAKKWVFIMGHKLGFDIAHQKRSTSQTGH